METSKKIIKEMLKEIQLHKRNKDDLLSMYVTERIDKQVQAYYRDIMGSYSVLSHQKNEIKVVKNLNKMLNQENNKK